MKSFFLTQKALLICLCKASETEHALNKFFKMMAQIIAKSYMESC